MKSRKEAVLNIGSEKLSLVVFDEKYPTCYIYESFREYSGYQDGKFFDKQELFAILNSMIQECEVAIFSKLEKVLVGVPGEFTTAIIKDYSMQIAPTRRKITTKDANSLLIEGAPVATETYIPISASPIYYIVDKKEQTLNPENYSAQELGARVSYIMCEKYFTELMSNIFASIGVKFEYTSILLAEAMFLLPHNARDKGAFLLDIGYISTSLAYAKGDGLLYTKSFSLGGGFVAADLMEVLDIPFEHAYALKSKINLNLTPLNSDMYYISANKGNFAYSIKRVNEVAEARIADISEYVKKAIEMIPYNTPEFTTLYLTGSGFDNIVGSKEILSKVVGLNVELITPTLIQYDKLSYASLASLIQLKVSQIKGKESLIQKLMNKLRKKNRRS